MPGPVLGAGEETMNNIAMASADMGVTVLVGTKNGKWLGSYKAMCSVLWQEYGATRAFFLGHLTLVWKGVSGSEVIFRAISELGAYSEALLTPPELL